ncbi:MAG TPA: DUF2490 domain-containing protein [Chryseosolibacter sp.]
MKKSAVVVLLLFCASFSFAQSNARVTTENFNSWFMYFGNHKFSEKLGWHAEVQLRRNDFVSNPQQLLVRTGVDFYTKNNLRWTVGYAFIQTHPYGDFAVPNDFPEHRIWQQLLVSQALGKVRLSHRYRLEQRLLGNASTGKFEDGRYENRFRYMAKATFNLTQSEKPMFLAVYDEIFVNFGEEVGYNLFDQNRLYVALGFTLSSDLKLEVGYLNQRVLLRGLDNSGVMPRNRVENNHTLQIGLFSSIPFFRR